MFCPLLVASRKYPYKIVMLHTEQQEQIFYMEREIRNDKGVMLQCKQREMEFVNVTSYFDFPPNFNSSGIKEPVKMKFRKGPPSWGCKYCQLESCMYVLMFIYVVVFTDHHMCRFWNSQIFKIPAIRKLDYFLRLDTDAVILSAWLDDPFARLHKQGGVYGYQCVMPDFPAFVHGMLGFVRSYMAEKELAPKFEGFQAYLDGEKGDRSILTNVKKNGTKGRYT